MKELLVETARLHAFDDRSFLAEHVWNDLCGQADHLPSKTAAAARGAARTQASVEGERSPAEVQWLKARRLLVGPGEPLARLRMGT